MSCDYFTPESCLFFAYSALSAALTLLNSGLVGVAAAATSFGFALPLAKAPEVETARIAKPTTIIFFMFQLPGKRRTAIQHRAWTVVKNRSDGAEI
jgi:hypothetical protein